MRSRSKEAAVATGSASGSSLLFGDRPPGLKCLQLRDQVNPTSRQWFMDLWLLLSGEDPSDASPFVRRRDGRAFAMICGGQLRLLEPKPFVFGALRSVGIEMS